MRRPSVSLVIAAALLALAGCGGDSGAEPGDGGPVKVDQAREDEVAGDEDASAAEIVEAGSPVAADRAADGSLLVAYWAVHRDSSGEVNQAAWRLYDADGEQVAEEKYDSEFVGDRVVGLDDGFLLSSLGVVGTDGTVTPADEMRDGGELLPKAGDLLVDSGVFNSIVEHQGPAVLRPDPATVYQAAPRFRGGSQGFAIGPDGRYWLLGLDGDRVTEVWQAADDGWEQVAPVRLTGDQHLLGFALVPAGDQVVVPIVRSVRHASRIEVDGFAVRRADAPLDEPWEYVDPGPLGQGRFDPFPTTDALGDSHYVWSSYPRGTYALDLGTGEWTEVPGPVGDLHWATDAGQGGLYAFHSEYAVGYFSSDLGATWERLPR